MAASLVSRFLNGDLSNGIYDEIRALADYSQSVNNLAISFKTKKDTITYHLQVNYGTLKRQFPIFVDDYRKGCVEDDRDRALEREFAGFAIDERTKILEVGGRIMKHVRLINQMYGFYSLTLNFNELCEKLDSDVNFKVIDVFLSDMNYRKVKKVVEEREVIEETDGVNEVVQDFEIKADPKRSLLETLANAIDYEKAVVNVFLTTPLYLRISYAHEFVPPILRIRSNVRVFHVTNVINLIFNEGIMLREKIEAFETMLVFYAQGLATLDEKMVLMRTKTNEPVAQKGKNTYTASYEDLSKKPMGERLWKFFSALSQCNAMSDALAKSVFERDVVQVMGLLGFLTIPHDSVNQNVKFQRAHDDVSEMVIEEGTFRLDFIFMWSSGVVMKREYLRNMLSTLMLKVASSRRRKNVDLYEYILFPVDSYGPSGAMRFDLRFATFILKAIVLSLS